MNDGNNHISIIWDFDKTLTPQDSTSKLIQILLKEEDEGIPEFWEMVQNLSGTQQSQPVKSISTSDAPVWMHILSRIAIIKDKDDKKIAIPLDDRESFREIASTISLYFGAIDCLEELKKLSHKPLYAKNNLKVNHFVISAGIKHFVESILQFHNGGKNISELIECVFGCQYKSKKNKQGKMENIPIYCMDKTTKTRSLFEINKGCFLDDAKYSVDDLLSKEEEWCPFENMIYIGDGDTDIPAFSLVKSRGGMSIGVYNNKEDKIKKALERAQKMREGQRIDLFTPADFSVGGDLFECIRIRCDQIARRYEAHAVDNSLQI